MTELETMQRAKMCMDKPAQGIDPISDQEVPNGSVLNNVRLARFFFYVSGVLEQLGLILREQQGRYGPYQVVCYSKEAQ